MLARLAAQMQAWGHTVRIVPPWDFWALHRFLPHLIVVHNAEDAMLIALAKAARRKGTHVINLLAEGAIGPYTAPASAGRFTKTKLDHLTVCWGPKAKALLVQYGREPDRVAVCGNPRFDKYARPLMDKATFCKRYGFDPGRPLVLYATTLSPGGGFDVRDFRVLPNFDRVYARLLALREPTAQAVMTAIAALPDVQFFIKLHPHDEPTLYRRLVQERGLHNVRVFEADAIEISDALNVCDMMIHWNSTTSAEAWFLGKPTILLHLDPELDFYLIEFTDGGDLVRSPQELVRSLRHYLDGGGISPAMLAARRRYVEDWFYRVDGRSLDRVVAVLNDYLSTHEIRPQARFTAGEFYYHAQVLYRKLSGLTPPERILAWLPPNRSYATEPEVAEALGRAFEERAAGAPRRDVARKARGPR